MRLCLTVLKNFLEHKGLCEDIVEECLLEAVQNLEFEKWRDAELYEDARDMATQISSEVHAMSNFDDFSLSSSNDSVMSIVSDTSDEESDGDSRKPAHKK